MRFVLYTDKTVTQCLSAINERLQVRATSARPGMDGWIEKGGTFSMAMSGKVIGRISRRTRLHGKIEREGGITVIRGYVSSGIGRQGQVLIFAALLLVGFIIFSRGDLLLALAAVAAGAALYIPLMGDHNNSVVLMKELRGLLKAKDTPPRKPAQIKSATPRESAPKSSLTPRKPAPALKKTQPGKTPTRTPPRS